MEAIYSDFDQDYNVTAERVQVWRQQCEELDC